MQALTCRKRLACVYVCSIQRESTREERAGAEHFFTFFPFPSKPLGLLCDPEQRRALEKRAKAVVDGMQFVSEDESDDNKLCFHSSPRTPGTRCKSLP